MNSIPLSFWSILLKARLLCLWSKDLSQVFSLTDLLLAKSAMSNTDFLGRAIDTVKKAIESDTSQDYEKAYQLYYQSLELFMLALKWEKNQKSKDMIRTKAAEYMERAEKLKNHLADSDKGTKRKPAAVGSNGKVSGGSGKAK